MYRATESYSCKRQKLNRLRKTENRAKKWRQCKSISELVLFSL